MCNYGLAYGGAAEEPQEEVVAEAQRQKLERKHTQWMSMFGIRVEADRVRKPEADLLLEAASRLAQPCLREHVTMPGDPTNLEVPWLDVSGGGRLPPVSCAFRGCGWTGGGCSTDAAYRDDCEHPWDQQLRARVLHAHVDQLFEALKPVVAHVQTQGLM